MFGTLETIETTVFARLPDELRAPPKVTERIPALVKNRRGGFLEGPSFDRDGTLYCTDIPYGRIFRISPKGEWTVFADYDGEPNGLRVAKDGRIVVADHKRGLLSFDPATADCTVLLDRPFMQRFIGLNDLTFASNGDLYFTDQGQSSYTERTGRVFRLRSTGQLDLLLEGLPGPNGLVLNKAEDILYVALTRTNEILAANLHRNYAGVGRNHAFIRLSGGGGPDGMAMAEGDRLVVCHTGLGAVWIFDELGQPTHRVKSCRGVRTTNLAFGGPDRRTLYITESESCTILKAEVPVTGNALYSHQA